MQGHIHISYEPLSIQSVRPFEIQKLLINRSTEQAIQFVGLAYSLCGQAQTFAAQLALNALSLEQQHTQAQRVAIETLKEHYISIAQLLCHVGILTKEQHSASLQGVGNWTLKSNESHNAVQKAQCITEQFKALLPTFEMEKIPHKEALTALTTLPIIKQLFQALTTSPKESSLPKLHQLSDIEQHMLHPDTWDKWVKTPTLATPIENTTLGRCLQHHHDLETLNLPPLQKRIIGKLVDIVHHIQCLTQQADSATLFGVIKKDKITVSWVETARGRLFHMAQTNAQNTTVLKYAISAPTEWNFHPQGTAYQLIASLPKEPFTQWKKHVEQITQIMDPCVPFNITKGAA